MAKGIKICRVCGKEYEVCHTQRPNLNNEFRWQEVACSPECGQIYLQRIIDSRSKKVDEPEMVEEQPIEEPEVEVAPKRRPRRKVATE